MYASRINGNISWGSIVHRRATAKRYDEEDDEERVLFGTVNSLDEENEAITNSSLHNMPLEILELISFDLDLPGLLNLASVDKKFNNFFTGPKYFKDFFRGVTTANKKNVTFRATNTSKLYSWVNSCLGKLENIEDEVDIECPEEDEKDKRAFYIWLRHSCPGETRIKLLSYLFILERIDTFNIYTDRPLPTLIPIAYSKNEFIDWLEKKRICITEPELKFLIKDDSQTKIALQIDLSKWQKHNLLEQNKLLAIRDKHNRAYNLATFKHMLLNCIVGCLIIIAIAAFVYLMIVISPYLRIASDNRIKRIRERMGRVAP
jgi:hypothetical protein